MSAAAILKVRCHYCSKWHMPGDIHTMGEGGILICQNCLDWNSRAVRYLGENVPPPGCQECGKSLAELYARTDFRAVPDNRLWLVPKDGIYQILCTQCREAYEQKRADLLADTAYGRQKGIGR